MDNLTKCQARVLAFLRSEVASKGYPPTYREIGAALGFKSKAGARDHLYALQRKGHIRIEPMLSRGIRPPGPDAPHLPPAEVKIYDHAIVGPPPWPEGKVVATRRFGRARAGLGEMFGIRLASPMTTLGLRAGDELVFQRGVYPEPQKLAAVILEDAGRIVLGHVHHEGSAVRVVAPDGSWEVRSDAARWKATAVLGTAVMMFRQIPGEYPGGHGVHA